ncbi:MAG TPA: hypothetical protein VMS96_14925 [Terriglobales bacterium]|nr:hypothetical protein [Terriglobales bacterium]
MTIVLCVMLTAILLFFIFGIDERVEVSPEKTRLLYLYERKDVIYDNLRDLNFEYKAGKFPDAEYLRMRTQLEEEAAAVLAEIDRLEQAKAEKNGKGVRA